MTYLERDYTFTIQQASIAVKGTIASLINSILVPILVSAYIKDENFLEANGLVSDVFMLGITNSFFPALIRLFDVYFWLSRLLEWIANKPFVKLRINQTQLNFAT